MNIDIKIQQNITQLNSSIYKKTIHHDQLGFISEMQSCFKSQKISPCSLPHSRTIEDKLYDYLN